MVFQTSMKRQQHASGIEKAGELEFKMVAGKNQTATKNKI